MALAPCYECGRRISSETTACPGCGVEGPINDQSWPNWTRRQFQAGRQREHIEGHLNGSDLPPEQVAALLDKYEQELGPVEAAAKLEDPLVATGRNFIESIGDWHGGKIALVWGLGLLGSCFAGSMALTTSGDQRYSDQVPGWLVLTFGILGVCVVVTWKWLSSREK